MRQALVNLFSKFGNKKRLFIVAALGLFVIVLVILLAVTAIIRQRKAVMIKEESERGSAIKITREVVINGKHIIAEIAASPEERIRGLMGRKELADGTGMLFTFGLEGTYTFWMKNMAISIDMIWIDKNMNVSDLDKNVPPCSDTNCEYYTPTTPIKYVLEVPAGWSDRNGIQIGNKVEFIDLINKTTAPPQNN